MAGSVKSRRFWLGLFRCDTVSHGVAVMAWRGKLGRGEARRVAAVLVGSCVLRLGKARQGGCVEVGYDPVGHGVVRRSW